MQQLNTHPNRKYITVTLVKISIILAFCPIANSESGMVQMRDGVKLPTIISLSESGSAARHPQADYPTVLSRGYSACGLSNHVGHFNKADYAFFVR